MISYRRFLGNYKSLEEVEHYYGYPEVDDIVIVDNVLYIYAPGGWILVSEINNYADEINYFISDIKYHKDPTDLFKNGYCYWFARILKERFNGTIMYDPTSNHFACKIDNKGIFDITGLISDTTNFVSWEDYKKSEPNAALRIYRDCILKLPHSDDINEISYENKTINGIKAKVYNEEVDL